MLYFTSSASFLGLCSRYFRLSFGLYPNPTYRKIIPKKIFNMTPPSSVQCLWWYTTYETMMMMTINLVICTCLQHIKSNRKFFTLLDFCSEFYLNQREKKNEWKERKNEKTQNKSFCANSIQFPICQSERMFIHFQIAIHLFFILSLAFLHAKHTNSLDCVDI